MHDNSERLHKQLSLDGLTPLWSAWIEQNDLSGSLPSAFRSRLRRDRQDAAGRYLLQRQMAAKVCKCLTAHGIPHAVFKGVAVRERLYADPCLRPADDVDLLIPSICRDAAISALIEDGFRLVSDRRTVSHQVSLKSALGVVDLHWALFRPGRSRLELAPLLLQTAHPRGMFSVLSSDADLLVMLVHPAFTKYVNGRTSRLIRVVDLDRTLRMTRPDWNWILPLIGAAGLRTAAWAVLHWQRSLMDTPVDPTVLRFLEPGRRQRRYLASWIDHRLTARLDMVPGLVQWAFTLALHERPADVLRVVIQLGKARLEAGSILKHLQQIA
ncbi:MAG: nucleotidyltransferase family protein [Lamprocystis purpurea]|nr:nucleotidyltransferase family protein [Lamprocystis purpurea]